MTRLRKWEIEDFIRCEMGGATDGDEKHDSDERLKQLSEGDKKRVEDAIAERIAAGKLAFWLSDQVAARRRLGSIFQEVIEAMRRIAPKKTVPQAPPAKVRRIAPKKTVPQALPNRMIASSDPDDSAAERVVAGDRDTWVKIVYSDPDDSAAIDALVAFSARHDLREYRRPSSTPTIAAKPAAATAKSADRFATANAFERLFALLTDQDLHSIHEEMLARGISSKVAARAMGEADSTPRVRKSRLFRRSTALPGRSNR